MLDSFFEFSQITDLPNAHGEEAIGSTGRQVFDRLAIPQSAETNSLDDGEVYEHIQPRVATHKAKTFPAIEPLHLT